MKNKLTKKYQPYSHDIGTSCLIPKSSWRVKVFPTLIEFTNLISEGDQEIFRVSTNILGPLSQFTVMQDLERFWIRIFGEGPQGYFSYRIMASAHEIIFFVERASKEGIAFTYYEKTHILRSKEEFIIHSSVHSFPLKNREKMHFGCHKSQDWTLMKRRLNLKEILPIWFELGKNIPNYPKLNIGVSQLLLHCESLVKKKDRERIGIHLLELFRAGFEGMLSPRLKDTEYQGIFVEKGTIPEKATPLIILGEGAALIRTLLVQEEKQNLFILPCLPIELHSGHFIGWENNDLSIDIEWSKKTIRRVTIHSKKDQIYFLNFQSSIKSFRIRKTLHDRGVFHPIGKRLKFLSNTTYTCDSFMK